MNTDNPSSRTVGVLAFIALTLAMTQPLRANLTVTTLEDSGPGSLRQAIAEAAPGYTIDFAVTGTITLTSGELVITNDLTITGPGATNLTVSGNNASRVFFLNNVTAAISGLTVSHGRFSEEARGAIQNASGSLTISNCAVIGNVSDAFYNIGSGISNEGELTVVNSIVSNNSGANCFGAGISSGFSARALKLINCTIAGNSGESAAGVFVYGGSCLITNTTVSGNVAWGSGAWATSYGAGISFVRGGPFWLCNSTVTGNSNMVNNTFAGSIFVTTGTLNLRSSIVAGNGGRVIYPDLGAWGSLVSQDFNLIGNTNGASITGVTTHNIYGQDPLLGPLADNGGATPTHALLPGSPAIDHGSNGGLATDQRGQLRGFNFSLYYDAEDGSDIGAYELQERAQTGPVFTVNTTDDAEDGVPGIAHCSLREAIAAANANADTNTIDFAVAVPSLHAGVTGTITLTNGQLTITNSVNINGPGAANLTVSGNDKNRVFAVGSASSVTMNGLTVADGKADFGGGIHNIGQLSMNMCMIRINQALAAGGGFYNSPGATALVSNCTFSGNAEFGFGGVARGGGALYNGGSLEIKTCTLSGNSAQRGGALHNEGGTCSVISSTICLNSAQYGGGIRNEYGNMVVGNSIVAGNNIAGSSPVGTNLSGAVYSQDYNLFETFDDCPISGVTTHNLYNQDPKLGPLADLGGPAPTHALRFDSPALDAGHCGGLTTDQRGLPRPIDSPAIANAEGGDGSDIGAYEADPNLRITAIEKMGSDIRLRFNTVLGRTYQLESEDEVTGPWSMLSNNITGDGSAKQALDTGAAGLPQRFYRAVQLP